MKQGDIAVLGRHRLLCGDAFNPEHVDLLMQGEKADMVFTDPPYNVGGTMPKALYSSRDAKVSKWLGTAMRDLTEAEWDRGFNLDALCIALEQVRPRDGTVYVCASHRTAPAIWAWMDRSGARHSNYCVWCKPNPMPSLSKRHPTWSTELLCYGTWGKHIFNFPPKGHALNWWQLSKNTPKRVHPTQKPEAVAEMAVSYSSQPDSIVVDLFAGSGSTLLACERMDRRARVAEISPEYCQVIMDRWEKLTGQQAVVASERVAA